MVWSSGSLSPTRPAKDAVQLPKPRPWRPKDRDRGRRRSYQVEQVAPKPNALVVWSGRQKFSQSGPTETRRHSGYDKNFRSLVPPRLDGTRVQSFLLETSKKSKPWSGNVRPELHFAVWSPPRLDSTRVPWLVPQALVRCACLESGPSHTVQGSVLPS